MLRTGAGKAMSGRPTAAPVTPGLQHDVSSVPSVRHTPIALASLPLATRNLSSRMTLAAIILSAIIRGRIIAKVISSQTGEPLRDYSPSSHPQNPPVSSISEFRVTIIMDRLGGIPTDMILLIWYSGRWTIWRPLGNLRATRFSGAVLLPVEVAHRPDSQHSINATGETIFPRIDVKS